MKRKGIIAVLIALIVGVGTAYLINEGPKTEIFEPLLVSIEGGQVSKLQAIKGSPTQEEIDNDMSIIEMNDINLYTKMLYEYSRDRDNFNKDFNKYINLYNSYMAGDNMYNDYYISVDNLIKYYNSVNPSNQENYDNNYNNDNEDGVGVSVGIGRSRYGASDDENTRFNGGSRGLGGFFGLGSGDEGEGESSGHGGHGGGGD